MIRVAVAYENGEIGGHFGHCTCFAIYEYGESVDDVTKTLVDASALHGHEQMVQLMVEQGVVAVICQTMGEAAIQLLLENSIYPVPGYAGDADTAADMLVTGQLQLGNPGGCGGGCGGCGGGCHGGDEEGCGCGGGCGC